MKNYKMLLSIVLALALAVCLIGCAESEKDSSKPKKRKETKTEEKVDNSSEKDEDLYEIYSPVVKEYKEQCEEMHSDYYIDNDCMFCSWALFDIDGNGVKELIIQQGSGELDRMQYVFEAKNGKATKIGEYEAWRLGLYEGENEMIGVDGMDDEGSVYSFTIVGGKLRKETVKTFSDGFPQYPNYITFSSLKDLELLKTSLK